MFLLVRPLVLVVAAIYAQRYTWSVRYFIYFLFLITATASETLLLLGYGATEVRREIVGGLIAGLLLVVFLDLLFWSIARLFRSKWLRRGVSWTVAVALLSVPGVPSLGTWLLYDPIGPSVVEHPDLMLMTSLPIIWGEGGAFDPESKPAETYKHLQAEFSVRPLDVLSVDSLGSGKLLLLAQPRLLAPEELVALDEWVRRGGRVLILIDPALRWKSELPLGDVRRPPPVQLLDPLLSHWSLAIERAPASKAFIQERMVGPRKLALIEPGRFYTKKRGCRILEQGLVAHCEIGIGKATLVTDADLLHDQLWIGPAGASRDARLADNPLWVADLLDELLGMERGRGEGDVQWALPKGPDETSLLLPILLLMLPFAAALAAAFILRRKTRA